MPGIVVTDSSGKPYAVLPASQVVRFIVPRYVQDDPSLAGVLGEKVADHAADTLSGKTVRDVLPDHLIDIPAAHAGDTIIEVAALMARLRSPLVAVMKDGRMHGVITASRLLAAALEALIDPMAALAIAVFVVAYALIATDRVSKVLPGLCGAAVLTTPGSSVLRCGHCSSVFFHRFSKPLPADCAPESPTPPRQLMSFAIQDQPSPAWREIVGMSALFGWALVVLIGALIR